MIGIKPNINQPNIVILQFCDLKTLALGSWNLLLGYIEVLCYLYLFHTCNSAFSSGFPLIFFPCDKADTFKKIKINFPYFKRYPLSYLIEFVIDIYSFFELEMLDDEKNHSDSQ